MTSYEKYTLGVGAAAATRLQLVNKIWNPHSLKFLDQHCQLSGKHVLDLACGTGIMTCELAKRVGSSGKVTAIDISEEQLTFAKTKVQQENLSNVEFLTMLADDIEKLHKKFDLIYCRFLLMHLTDVPALVKKMVNCLAPHGQLICEEAVGYQALECHPYSAAFEYWKKISMQRSHIHQADDTIGKQLYKIFKDAGLKNLQLQITQPVLHSEEEKNLPWRSLSESIPACVAAGLATEAEMLANIEILKRFAKEDHIVFALPYMQALGEKA